MTVAFDGKGAAAGPVYDDLVPGRGIDSGAVMLTPEEGAAKLRAYAAACPTVDTWEARAGQVRAAMLAGAELDPWPNLAAPSAVIRDKRTYADYSVENVFFASFPGFYVTGNLYRPSGRSGPFPGILINMGHFPLSRHDHENQYLASTLARMGAAVFVYDMLGFGESHQPGKADPGQDHNLIKATKLELLNSLRSLDFLVSLGDVNPDKIGVTGASGGGSRTMFLTALDQRVKACAPAVMVSDYFYGGCVCESGMPICYQARFDTVLADIAALAAPRPMLVVSDGGDWTNTVPEAEYPYIKRIYDLYGAGGLVSNVHLPEEGHDFGYNKRKAVYDFFACYLGLAPYIDEKGAMLEAWSLQRAFTPAHPRPADALVGDEAIMLALDRI